MAYHYYIYYRVPVERIGAIRERAADLLGRVTALTGVAGRVLRRSDEPGLFMEIYEGVLERDRFERGLDEAERAADAVSWPAPGQSRHRECFED